MTFEEMEAKLDRAHPDAHQTWDAIGREALTYSTPLFSVENTENGEKLKFAGTGTFLRQGERYFVLTARHVWQELKDRPAMGVALREGQDHRYFIETKAITPRGPERPSFWTELGPDIVLLEVPLSAVGTIKASRGFYEMDGGLKAMAKGDRNETFLLMGTPEVLGKYTQRHASVRILGMWDSEPKEFTEGDWDYVDFKAQIHPESDVKSFGGVSGGGLWRVQMYPRPDSDEIASTIALEGVAFWELGTSGGKGVVRCHGLASVRKVLESA
jgi:hypothetical protein